MTINSNEETMGEEMANSITHALGMVFSIVALFVLVTFAGRMGDIWKILSFAIYGTTMILMYLASTFYHAVRDARIKKIFKIFDHSAIYLLIAGSYTPFCLVTLRGPWGWSILGTVWGIAVLGIVFKAFFTGRFRIASTLTYVIMGWIVIIAVKPVMESLPREGLIWLLMGGISYTAGIIFYSWKRLPFNHSIWHLFVLGGSTLHFFTIFLYVLPV
ncbi:MAG: hemolysin III family protein [Spirochaetes bacterium]|jgi:hemolysin III|nr:hemolysin III family protein [Spirochaetota bacterium]